jgi:hypothetical protein
MLITPTTHGATMTSPRQRAKSKSRQVAIAAPPIRSKGKPKQERPFSELPSVALLVLGGVSFLFFAWIGPVVYKVTPEAVAIGNSMPLGAWGWKGYFLFAILAALAMAMWSSWTLASRCQAILVERYFK